MVLLLMLYTRIKPLKEISAFKLHDIARVSQTGVFLVLFFVMWAVRLK